MKLSSFHQLKYNLKVENLCHRLHSSPELLYFVLERMHFPCNNNLRCTILLDQQKVNFLQELLKHQCV